MSWVEPKEFVAVQRQFIQPASIWVELSLGLVLVLLLTADWAMKKWMLNQPVAPWWEFLPTTNAIVVFLWILEKYLQPWLESKFDMPVEIGTSGIGRHTSQLRWIVHFKALRSFAIHELDDYRVLEIIDDKERQVLIGVPNEVDCHELESILMERGLIKLN